MTILGIDLGTTYSLCAVFDGDAPRLIPNALGDFLTPSAVALGDDDSLLVGSAARSRLIRHPETSVARFKRFMGTDKVFRLGRRQLTAENLSTFVLASLRRDAEVFLGKEVRRAVVSVPAYFNDQQRRATVAAGAAAGLQVRRLINEPTAAALAYGLHEKLSESTFLVFDLGGGTFDVSILEMFESVMEVRASAGDAFLGGEDFTELLAREIASRLGETWQGLNAERREYLHGAAERAKHMLSNQPSATLDIRGKKGASQAIVVTQEEFGEITKSLVERLRRPIERSLYDSGLHIENLDRVVLVGGATRMPLVRSLAARLFGRLPERGIDPDQVVALGAAVQAGLLANERALKDVVVTDVSPFTLGIETAVTSDRRLVQGRFSPIIERNMVLPCSREERFHTVADNQKAIHVLILQGESPRAADNLLLGEIHVAIPPAPAGVQAIDVRFTYDVSGLLEVDVRTVSTGATQTLVINGAPSAMSDEEAAARLSSLAALKVHPRDKAENRSLIEALSNAYAMALDHDREYLQRHLDALQLAIESQDSKKIEAARQTTRDALAAFEQGYVR